MSDPAANQRRKLGNLGFLAVYKWVLDNQDALNGCNRTLKSVAAQCRETLGLPVTPAAMKRAVTSAGVVLETEKANSMQDLEEELQAMRSIILSLWAVVVSPDLAASDNPSLQLVRRNWMAHDPRRIDGKTTDPPIYEIDPPVCEE